MGIKDSRELALQDWMGSAGFDRDEDAWPRKLGRGVRGLRRGREAGVAARAGACAGSPSWDGRSGADTWPRGTATACRASTSPGARGRRWWSRSSAACATAQQGGPRRPPLPPPRGRAHADGRAPSTACTARCWSPATSAAVRPARARGGGLRAAGAGGHRHVAAASAATTSSCAATGRRGWARRRNGCSAACPRTWTGGCWRWSRQRGAASSTPTACGTTRRGSRTGIPSGPCTASASFPARRRCGWTRSGGGSPRRSFPASTRWGRWSTS